MYQLSRRGYAASLIAALALVPLLSTTPAPVTARWRPAPPQAGRAPMDLVTDQVDPNGLPLNPSWQYQLDHGTPPNADTLCAAATPCTSQRVTYDRPVGWPGAICIGAKREGTAFAGLVGHANWFNVAYTGLVTWGHWAQEDDDNTFNLVSPDAPGTRNNPAGLTTAFQEGLHAEFTDAESSYRFTSPWWRTWESDKQRGEQARASRNAQRIAVAVRNGWYNPGGINGKRAILVGLAGLDCEHACLMELHPLFAAAIEVKNDPHDTVWAIFVRRSGGEGFCSSNQHTWDTQRVSFRLPGPAGALATRAPGTAFRRDTVRGGPALNVQPILQSVAGAAVVTFDLGSNASGAPLINGELHLRWTPNSAASSR